LLPIRNKRHVTAPVQSYAAFVLFLLATCAVVNIYYTQPIVASIASLFNVSTRAASAAYTVASMSYSVSLVFCGWLATRFGAKRVMISSGIALGAVALIPVDTYATFLFARMLQGLLAAGVPAIGMAYVNRIYENPQRMHAIFIAGLLFGATLARVLGGIGAYYMGVRELHVSCLLVTSLVAMAAAAVLPEDRQTGESHSPLDLLRETTSRSTLYGAVTAFMFFAAFAAVYNTLGFVLAGNYGLDDFEIGLVFAIGVTGMVASQIVPGVVQYRGVYVVVSVMYLLAAAAVTALAFESFINVLIGIACLNFAIFGIHTAVSQQTASLAKRKEHAMSVYMICYFLGGTTGAGIAGLLYPLYGWHAVLALSVLFVGMGFLINLRRAARAA
jgi:predicted MFS family arabinose efflux permease